MDTLPFPGVATEEALPDTNDLSPTVAKTQFDDDSPTAAETQFDYALTRSSLKSSMSSAPPSTTRRTSGCSRRRSRL